MKKLFHFIADFFRIDGYSSATRLIFILGSFVALTLLAVMIIHLKIEPITAATAFAMIEGTLCGLKLIQNGQENKTEVKP